MDSTTVKSSPASVAVDGTQASDGSTIRPISVSDGSMATADFPSPFGLDVGSSSGPMTKVHINEVSDPNSIIPGPVNSGLPNIGKDTNNWGEDTTVQNIDSDTFPDRTVRPDSDAGKFTSDVVTPNQGLNTRLPKTSFPAKDPSGSY